ncbi:hypothetical protein VR45_18200, partial [Streptomyces sp. NRRL S-495]
MPDGALAAGADPADGVVAVGEGGGEVGGTGRRDAGGRGGGAWSGCGWSSGGGWSGGGRRFGGGPGRDRAARALD